MIKKIAFLTTVFPMNEEYLIDSFGSLDRQTYKIFDVVVVNDGYENFKKIREKYHDLDIIELPYSDTIAKNREYGINYVIGHKYDILIFGDSDDYFSDNRIEKSIELLTDYDIVVNDLSLFDHNGIYSKKYISNRIQDHTVIDFDFIKDKNIFGLSNTSVNVNILDRIVFNEEIVAVDWFLYKKLLRSGNKAIFTNEMETYYRQYENNTIGLNTTNGTFPLWWEKTDLMKESD